MPAQLIGVDVGSTHVKAVLWDREARHVARRDTPTCMDGNGAAHPTGELLAAVEAVVGECAAASEAAEDIAGVGVTSMAEAGVPLDRAGRPLGEITAWFDPRPAPYADQVRELLTPAVVFRRTGLRAEAKCTIAKLLWWRAERPEAYARLWRWAGVAELVGFHLAGGLATNASLATRTLAFDAARREWDPELLALAGLRPEHFPEVVPLGRPSGALTAAAAARLGLRAGIAVAVAGHDHVVAGLGAGVAHPGEALDSMGSAEAALLITAQPMLDDEVGAMGFSSGAHAVDGLGYVGGGLQSSGSMLEWFVDTFLRPRVDDGDARYADLRALLAAAPVPSEVLVKPYPRGRTAPFPDRGATLEIVGLLERHGLADLAGAIVDAAAYHVRWMFDELVRVTRTDATSVRVTGGGTRNERWVTAKVAVTPRPLSLVRTDEAAALGAALVAGLASGEFASLDDALAHAAPAERLAAPPDVCDRYRTAYAERWLPWVRAGIVRAG